LVIIIKDGVIVDGTGNPWFKADVAVAGNKIVNVANLKDETAEKVVDAKGLVITPGFIDLHNHSDYTLLANPKAESMVRQGVTTLVVGNCGHSVYPLKKESSEELRGLIFGYVPEVEVDWKNLLGYFNRLERQKIAVNVAALVGHSAVRVAVIGFERRTPTYSELEEMKDLVAQEMEAGAFGLSTGLEYPPGSYADDTEITELCRVVSQYGGFHSTHIRNRAEGFLKSTAETINIAEEAAIPTQISHNVPRYPSERQADVGLNLIEGARNKGLDVTCDSFPPIHRKEHLPSFVWASTSLTALLPSWTFEDGTSALVKRLGDPTLRSKLKVSDRPMARLATNGHWNRIVLEYAEKNPEFVGKSFGEIAKLKGCDPWDALISILLEEGEECYSATISYAAYALDDIRKVIIHPFTSIISDGLALAHYGPLRNIRFQTIQSYGYIPLLFEKCVRKDGLLTLEEAVRKCTSLPASRLRLKDRGMIKEGMRADITIFSPERIRCMASFEEPRQYPEGIEYVLVNGQLVIENGKPTANLPGETLRKEH